MMNREKNYKATQYPDQKGLTTIIHAEGTAARAQVHEGELERSFSWIGALGLGFR